jgi:PAS domain S-box-containing protein
MAPCAATHRCCPYPALQRRALLGAIAARPIGNANTAAGFRRQKSRHSYRVSERYHFRPDADYFPYPAIVRYLGMDQRDAPSDPDPAGPRPPSWLDGQVDAGPATGDIEARYRLVTESWAQAVWETDAAGVVVNDSSTWRAYTGQTSEEFLGYGWLNAVHADDRAYAERQWRDATQARTLVDAEFRLRAPGGGWRWTNVRAAPLFDAAGEIQKWVGINIDIDARKRAEDALRESEERQAFLLELSDVLRPLSDAADIERTAAALLGRKLGATRVFYATIDPGGTTWSVIHDYADGVPSNAGRYPLTGFQEARLAQWRSGRMSSVSDSLTDPGLNDDERAAYAVFGARAAIGVPLVANGRFAALLVVNQREPRAWSANDLALTRETAERTWSAIERARAEAALRDRERLLRGVLDGMDEGFGIIGPDFTVLEYNREALRMDGRPRDAIVGLTHWAAFPGTEHSDVGHMLKTAMATREPAVLDHCYTWSGGRSLWLETRVYPTDDGAIAVFWRDITDRKRAADALHDSEKRYRALFTSMDEAYAVVDVLKDDAGRWVDFRFVDANPAFLTHTGMPWPVGRTATDLLGAPNPRWTALYGQALDSGEPLRIEEAEPSLGRVFDLNIFALDPDRHRVAVLFTDITARKRAAERLTTSEERLRSAVEVAKIGLWDWDMRTDTISWSDEHFRMSGFAVGEVTPTYEAWAASIHPDDRAATEAALVTARDTHTEYVREFRCLYPDGTVRWHAARGRFFYDAAGIPVRMIGAQRDTTERREAADHQQILLAELQHRVRNILAVIRSIISRSNDGERSTEEYVQHLQGRISALARTQVLLTRRAGASVDLEDMIRDELLAQVAIDEQFSLSGPDVELSPKAAEVLTLAIHELATNATKYGAFSRIGGHVVVDWAIEAREDSRWLILQWTERGVPIVDAAPRRHGFGSALITRRIPYELKGDGQISFRPGGLHSRIEFPLQPGDSILQTNGVVR